MSWYATTPRSGSSYHTLAEFRRVYFSRDGEWVNYLSYPDHALWRMRKDGSEKLRLISSGLVADEAQWSPDSRKIAFGSTIPGKVEAASTAVFTIPVDGGTPEKIVEGGSIPSWSPDGNSLAYQQWHRHSQSKCDIRVIDLRTRDISVIPDSAGKYGPVWSPDGRFLIAVTPLPVGDLLIFDLHTQTWSVLAKGRFVNWQWSLDGKYVYAVDSNPGKPHAVRVRIGDRGIETITTLENVRRIQDEEVDYWAAPAPDGSLLVTRDIGTQEIYALAVKWP